MPGDPDPLYVLARRALLDGLEALTPHLDSIVVVGAQAVYVHTGPADLPVAEFTTDADVAIAPEFLADEPSIQTLLEGRGFELQEDPGKWRTSDGIQVDLLVPEAVAGPGRRGARLPGHGKRAARRAKGIEGVLVDNTERELGALDPDDSRSFRVRVAGPAALLVAKVHKIAERVDQPDRLVKKDALDVLRLLQAIPTNDLVAGVDRLRRNDLAGPVTEEAIGLGDALFGPGGAGLGLAEGAVRGLTDTDVVRQSLQVLWADLATALA
ncbi:MAG: hypothetical protein JJLCMIEE_03570 [Acidimicrobiales bacterium]|nr:MAG: hypothetical protein EDR02_16030 [Actinomycetota bacterium]MBV6510423.1 hypothetical protein [Acidimicrobiales bacterium]RIK03771.1 MAG: hypothetical protein DCC48_15710 [Acidobacteriota bacterium]